MFRGEGQMLVEERSHIGRPRVVDPDDELAHRAVLAEPTGRRSLTALLRSIVQPAIPAGEPGVRLSRVIRDHAESASRRLAFVAFFVAFLPSAIETPFNVK